jgi:hypothetical protein
VTPATSTVRSSRAPSPTHACYVWYTTATQYQRLLIAESNATTAACAAKRRIAATRRHETGTVERAVGLHAQMQSRDATPVTRHTHVDPHAATGAAAAVAYTARAVGEYHAVDLDKSAGN